MKFDFFLFFFSLAQVIAVVDAIDQALLRFTGSHSQSKSAQLEDLKGWGKKGETGENVKHSICMRSVAGFRLTWLLLLPQGELTLKCSLTMKWPWPIMVVNSCMLQWCWG